MGAWSYAAGVVELSRSARLCAWANACGAGLVGPDDAADAVRGEDPQHLVVGLAAEPLSVLEAIGLLAFDDPLQLALPAPGDPLGLGGPAAFNTDALEAGEAVVADGIGLVPVLDARTVVWHAQPAAAAPYVDAGDAGRQLRQALLEVTDLLVDLDVASWQPEIPDTLANARHRDPVALPHGYDARHVETLERALLCLEIVRLAREDHGSALSSYEMTRRSQALDDLDRSARRALVGVCSTPPRGD